MLTLLVSIAALIVISFLALTIIALSRRVADLESHKLILTGAVYRARAVFHRYAALHRAKRTEDADVKADANYKLFQKMDRALDDTDFEEPGPLQQVFMHYSEQAQERNAIPGVLPLCGTCSRPTGLPPGDIWRCEYDGKHPAA